MKVMTHNGIRTPGILAASERSSTFSQDKLGSEERTGRRVGARIIIQKEVRGGIAAVKRAQEFGMISSRSVLGNPN